MRCYNAVTHGICLPIVFPIGWEKEYREFLDRYDPREGFFLAKEKNCYLLYSGGIKYKLFYFTNNSRQNIALRPKNKDLLSQRDTIDMQTRAIRIVGMSTDWFFNQEQSFSLGPIRFERTEKKLQELLTTPEAVTADKTPDPLWEQLSRINDSKQAFESQFLIHWPYLRFVPGTNLDDKYTCVFTVAPLSGVIAQNEARFQAFRETNGLIDEDDDGPDGIEVLRETYYNAFTPGTRVEIPLNRKAKNGKQEMLYAMVVRLEVPGVEYDDDGNAKLPEGFFRDAWNFNQPWTLELAFMDDNKHSTADIPLENGILHERVSTDYKNTKKALLTMYNPKDDPVWTAAEQILVHHQADPIPMETEPVFTARLTDNQKQAITMALNVPDFLLVQGPPGTGKTTIITEMVRNFVAQEKRVLVCSKGNLAVDNVLEKWINENKSRSDSHLCVRLGQNFRLEFLKDYTPGRVVVNVQEAVYNKSQAERDRLSRQVSEKIRHVEENQAGVLRLAEQAIAACDLTEALQQLTAKYLAASKAAPRSKVLQQKHHDADLALRAVYHELVLPCHHFLGSAESPTQEQLSRFNFYYENCAKKILSALQTYEPGFFERLKTGSFANTWKAAEQQLRNRSQSYYHNQKIQGNLLQANPLLCVPSLQNILKEDPKKVLPPQQYKKQLEDFRGAVLNFSRQENIRLGKIRTVLNQWLKELGSGVSNSLERDLVVRSIPLIGATCMGVMSDDDYKATTYDVVIVDEAGQIPIFDLIVPLVKAKKVILIGDHIQLPPMDEQDFATFHAAQKADQGAGPEFEKIRNDIAKWYNVSTFQTLFEAEALKNVRITLDTQFRMHPDISNFVAQTFYGGRENYKAGVTGADRTLRVAGFDQPIYFYDTCDLPPEQGADPDSISNTAPVKGRYETDHNPGYSNEAEARKIAQILKDLILAIRSGEGDSEKLILRDKSTQEILGYDIGVISGYQKQVDRIYDLTKNALLSHMEQEEAQLHMDRFMISTVDSFQGRDNQVIIFSMTRSNEKGKIGFLKDVRRLNVAMTRAKSLLIMVGDSSTLRKCNKPCTHDPKMMVSDVYQALVDYCNGGNDHGHNYYHKLKGAEDYGTH